MIALTAPVFAATPVVTITPTTSTASTTLTASTTIKSTGSVGLSITGDQNNCTYQIEVGGTGAEGTGKLISSGSTGTYAVAGTALTITINGSEFGANEGDYVLYVYMKNATNEVGFSTKTISIRNTPPPAPTGMTATGNDGNIVITVPSLPSQYVTGFKVYYDTVSHATDKVYPGNQDLGGTQSLTLLSLANGVTYYLALTAYDGAGNESALSTEITATTTSTVGLSDVTGDPGGGCFIATAAAGYYDDSSVMTLRGFRDRVLLPSPLGRSFVSSYYRASPPIARYIAGHPLVRSVVYALVFATAGLIDHAPLALGGLALALIAFILSRLKIATGRPTLTIVALIAFGLASPTSARADNAGFGYGISTYSSDAWKNFYGEKSGFFHFFYESSFIFKPLNYGIDLAYIKSTGSGIGANGVATTEQYSAMQIPLSAGLSFKPVLFDLFSPFVEGGGILSYNEESKSDGGNKKSFERYGYYYGGGLSIMLDFLDPEGSSSLLSDWGIEHSAIYAGYRVINQSMIRDSGGIHKITTGINLDGTRMVFGMQFFF